MIGEYGLENQTGQAGDRIRRNNAEVVLFALLQVPARAQQEPCLFDGVTERFVGLGSGFEKEQAIASEAAKVIAEGFQRQRNKIVLWYTKDRPFGDADADDSIGQAGDVYFLTGSGLGACGEQGVGDIHADEGHAHSRVVLSLSEIAALRDVDVVNLGSDGHRAINGHFVSDLCLTLDL